MTKFIKPTMLLVLVVCISLVSVEAQEAMSESYFQAAAEAIEKGSYSEAAKFARLGLAEVERLKDIDTKGAQRQTIRGLNLLSGALIELKSYAEAEAIKRREIKLMESIKDHGSYPAYSINYPMSLESLGLILTEGNKFEEAEDVYREALAYRERVYGPSDKTVATSLINLGNLYLRQGKASEAEVMSRRALSILSVDNELKDDDIFTLLRAARNLALIDIERKKYAEAEKTYKFIVISIEKFYGQRDSSLLEPLEEYAKLLRVMKRPIEATRIESRIRQLKHD